MRLLSRSDQETETAVLEPADDVDPQLSDDDLELLDQPETDADEVDEDQPSARGAKRRWRPRLATLLAGVAILVSGALLAASGYMIWYHQQADREQQRRAEFSAAASQAAVTLMSIDSVTG